MGSMIHGIRILKKEGRVLTFKTFLIYSDWQQLPRTHGFALMLLEEKSYNSEVYPKSIDYGSRFQNTKDHIVKLEVKNFQNFPIKKEFLENTWHYLQDDGRFHYEKHLPQATYTLEVTDENLMAHIEEGMVWETACCDLDGASWYLEYKDEKTHKFYHFHQSDLDPWKLDYGKVGTKGRSDIMHGFSFNIAKYKVEAKLKKGYKLIHKNFDTPFDLEGEIKEAVPVDYEKLAKAVSNGNIKKARAILETGVNPNLCKCTHGHPILYEAACYGSVNMTKLLLEHGADPNQYVFLPDILFDGKIEKINLLLEKGADISLIGESGCQYSVLHGAALRGLSWLVKAALEKGVDVNYPCENGETALHYALESSSAGLETINILLDNGADVNAPCREGKTPLHYATTAPNAIEVIDLLIANGADPNANGASGTPFHLAVRGGVDVMRHLIDLGADIEGESSLGNRPVHLAVGSLEGLKELLDLGVDAGLLGAKGLTPTQLLCETVYYQPKVIERLKLLMEKGYALQPQNPNGITTQDCLFDKHVKKKKKLDAEKINNLQLLLEIGYDASEADSDKMTLLHFIVMHNQASLLETALTHPDIKLNVQDKYGWTPLHYAAAHADGKCVDMILEKDADVTLKSRRIRNFLKKKIAGKSTPKDVAIKLGNTVIAEKL